MKDFFIFGVIVVLAIIVALFGIDREQARRDYVNGDEVTGCIFQSNCNYYNEK